MPHISLCHPHKHIHRVTQAYTLVVWVIYKLRTWSVVKLRSDYIMSWLHLACILCRHKSIPITTYRLYTSHTVWWIFLHIEWWNSAILLYFYCITRLKKCVQKLKSFLNFLLRHQQEKRSSDIIRGFDCSIWRLQLGNKYRLFSLFRTIAQ